MNLFSLRMKRVLACAMALVLFVSGTSFGLATRATAAPARATDLYTLIGESYYPDNADARGILSSGALKGNENVSIRIPEAGDNLISASEGVLTAKDYASNYKQLKWEPFLCYINDEFAGHFSSGNSVEVSAKGKVRVEVSYRLHLEGYDDIPELAWELMLQGKYQLNMLNKLSADTYMGYMAQFEKNKVSMLGAFLDPNGPFVIEGLVLNNDPQKDEALRACFSESIAKLTSTCFDDETGLLKIYKLLKEYKSKGLAYYYEKNGDFRSEINVLSTYLTEMLAPSDGLTKAEKLAGLDALIKYADGISPGAGAFAVYLPRLEEIMGDVKSSLTPPNEAIDVSSPNLGKLTAILENGAEFDIGPDYTSTSLTVTVSTELCNHVFSSEADDNCDICGSERPTDSDEDQNDDVGDVGGGDDVGSVDAATRFVNSIEKADDGDVIRLTKTVALTENVKVSSAIVITGADKLNESGHTLVLNTANAGITADSALEVASAIDGYIPVMTKSGSQYSYALVEASAPKTGGKTAGSKVETLKNTRYLYLDLDPVNGMTLNAFRASTAFSQLADYTVSITVAGNSGSALIKTGDRMTVTARNKDAADIAKITYVIIVMGDTNCNGKVNSSDAAVTKNISAGKQSSVEARMAADVNFSGTPETPRVNSSDVSYVMAKWFAWDLNQYVSNLK